MEKTESAIFTNMCMVYDDAGKILVQNRKESSWPGIAFPGGHVEPGEPFVDSVIREVKEETGLTISDVTLCGIKQWASVDHPGTRYVVLYFKTKTFSGEIRSSDEGEVFWIRRDELQKYTLANGFEQMLTVFESDTLNEHYFYREDGQWKSKFL